VAAVRVVAPASSAALARKQSFLERNRGRLDKMASIATPAESKSFVFRADGQPNAAIAASAAAAAAAAAVSATMVGPSGFGAVMMPPLAEPGVRPVLTKTSSLAAIVASNALLMGGGPSS
jgi:hypothetical protein